MKFIDVHIYMGFLLFGFTIGATCERAAVVRHAQPQATVHIDIKAAELAWERGWYCGFESAASIDSGAYTNASDVITALNEQRKAFLAHPLQ